MTILKTFASIRHLNSVRTNLDQNIIINKIRKARSVLNGSSNDGKVIKDKSSKKYLFRTVYTKYRGKQVVARFYKKRKSKNWELDTIE